MNTQETSNILWAMAKFQWTDVNLIRKIVKQAVNKSKDEFKPQAVFIILWSIATLKYYDEHAIQHFVDSSKTCVQEMNGQDVANLMWALQQLRYYDQDLCLKIEDIILNNNNIVCNSQQISNTMLAFTDFGLQNKQKICEILVPEFLGNKLFEYQECCNLLYCLALLDCPVDLSQQVVDKLLAHQKQNDKISSQDINCTQIQLAQVFYTNRRLKLDFPSDLEQKCKNQLQVYMRKKILVQNSLLDDVFLIVKSHFEFAQQQILVCDDQIDVNIALQLGEETKVVIMTNSPSSYFVNCPEKLLGRGQHREFILEQLGWQVVEVSAFKWNNNQQYQQKIIDDVKAKFV